MTGSIKNVALAGGFLAGLLLVSTADGAGAAEDKGAELQQLGILQNAAASGITCEHVRAKVAEAGVAATYAYARYIGLSSRDIAKVRKACSV